MSRLHGLLRCAVAAGVLQSLPVTVRADDAGADRAPASSGEASADRIEDLVPALAGDPYAVEPGPRKFARRLAFSPGYGWLGDNRLYVFRLAYNPSAWLGYEGSVGHNPAGMVHALLHTFNVVLRRPLPGRLQPYGSAGYGMIMVFPGQLVNADPVTKNALTLGGGAELYIRSDVAVRAEVKHITVLGGERGSDDTVAYRYREITLGFSFYRTLGR